MVQFISRFPVWSIPKIIEFLFKSQYKKELSVNIWGRKFYLKPNKKKLGVDGYIYLYKENYEPDMRGYFDYVDLSNATFLDIGANAGYWTIYASQMKNCNIISFEPHPVTFARLKKNVDSLTNCIAFNIGLSNSKGELNIIEMLDNGSNYLSTNKIGIPVGVTTLDTHFSEHPDLYLRNKIVIKIDVEGAEQFVIEGGSSFIMQRQPYIIVEMIDKHLMRFDSSVEKLDRYIKSFGYKSYIFNEKSKSIFEDNEIIEGNILYLIDK